MITVTCQYTGIEFEAATKRSKNHPAVSLFLNETNRDRTPGAYRKATELLAEANGQYDDIDSLMADVRQAYSAWKNGEAQPVARRRTAGDHLREQKARRQQRDEQNAILRQNGYRWEKREVGSEDSWAGAGSLGAGIGEEAGYRWQLVAPNGNIVTVEQAIAAISR